MTEGILIALITGGMSLLGVVITCRRNASDMAAKLDKQQAVMETKLEDLTREVRKHNGFAERIPVLEEKMKVANNRILDLEKKG